MVTVVITVNVVTVQPIRPNRDFMYFHTIGLPVHALRLDNTLAYECFVYKSKRGMVFFTVYVLHCADASSNGFEWKTAHSIVSFLLLWFTVIYVCTHVLDTVVKSRRSGAYATVCREACLRTEPQRRPRMAKNTCAQRVTGAKVEFRRKTRSIRRGREWASASSR